MLVWILAQLARGHSVPKALLMFEWRQWGLQNGLSPAIEEFIYFHDYLIIVLTFIITGVAYFIVELLVVQDYRRALYENQYLEAVWTILPAVILVAVAVPSLRILYRLDSRDTCYLSLKVSGHQWYWSYEYAELYSENNTRVRFDSYIISHQDLSQGEFRLLETDNRVVLPYSWIVRVLISRADVLHSWAVPSLGVKVDAMPGRLNQSRFISDRPGLAYGQCSEICGANHRFMPIVIEFIRAVDFLSWGRALGEA